MLATHEDINALNLPPEIPEACAKELKSSNVCCLRTSTDDPSCVSIIVDCRRYSPSTNYFELQRMF